MTHAPQTGPADGASEQSSEYGASIVGSVSVNRVDDEPYVIDAEAPLMLRHGATTTTSAPASHSAARSSNNPTLSAPGWTPSSFVIRTFMPSTEADGDGRRASTATGVASAATSATANATRRRRPGRAVVGVEAGDEYGMTTPFTV